MCGKCKIGGSLPGKHMDIYDRFYSAYRIYNESLFEGKLGEILITFVRKNLVKGYYSFSRFEKCDGEGKKISEISINPEYFGCVSDEEILSTLVHEMCHMFHDESGYRCTSGYHSKKWAEMMIERGLIPSSTGKPGGNMTGFLMSHYIVSGGRFDDVTKRIIGDGFSTGMVDVFSSRKVYPDKENEGEGGTKSGFRYKYSCGCTNVWGKRNLSLICGKCGKAFEMKG